MSAKAVIEHVPAGWIKIFKSEGMRAVVDEAGQRIAAIAGEHFEYVPSTNDKFTVAGFVYAADAEGDELEATEKALTKAVYG